MRKFILRTPCALVLCAAARVLCAAALVFCSALSVAQTFPTRTVRIVVPTSAGGVTDIIARAITPGLSAAWGQPVVVDNRPGAAQIIGSDLVAKSPADGYTLLVSDSATFVINPHLYKKLPYDALRDFTPITAIAQIAPIIAVGSAVPVNNIRELIALAKSKPGTLSYGSFGSGSYVHIAMENFKQLAGVDMIHVPYKGSSPAANALLAGEVTAMLVHVSVLAQHAKAGKLRLIAAATPKRLAEYPDLPTVAESGLPGFETGTWFGLLGPGGVPREVVSRIHDRVSKLVSAPEFRAQYLTKFSFEPMNMTSDEFNQFMKRDFERWAPLVKASGAVVE